MPTSLTADSVRDVLARLRDANLAFAERYPGETGRRQPVHTVYGGAHLFKADTAARLRSLALRALEEYAPDARAISPRRSICRRRFADTIHARVVEKLRREPVEDFRADFEDGYGNRPDAEEDGHAEAAAREMAAGLAAGTLPPFIGIRIKPFNEELRERSVRTLDLFLTTLVREAGGQLPENFVVTLPKVTIPEQVGGARRPLRPAGAGARPAGRVAAPGDHGRDAAVDPRRSGRVAPAAPGAGGARPLRGRALRHLRLHRLLQHHGGPPGHDPPGLRLRQAHDAGGLRRHGHLDLGRRHQCAAGPAAPARQGRPAAHAGPGGGEPRGRPRAWRLHSEHVRHSLVGGFYQGWDLHPAQLVTRYAALFAFFLEGLDAASERLRNFVQKAAQATLVGEVFDDAATGQGLLNYFLRAVNCGAIPEEEALERSGLTLEELRGRSFVKDSGRPARVVSLSGGFLQIKPYGSAVATKISLRFSNPKGVRSTGMWCMLGIERWISSMSTVSRTASPMA